MGQFKLCTSGEEKVDWDVTSLRPLLQKGRQAFELQLAAFLKALLFCDNFGSCSILHRKKLVQSILTIKLCCTTASAHLLLHHKHVCLGSGAACPSRTVSQKGIPLPLPPAVAFLHFMEQGATLKIVQKKKTNHERKNHEFFPQN